MAATKSPIVFIGVGEHIHDLERFEPQAFVGKLLGRGDISGLVEKVKDMNLDQNKNLIKNLQEGSRARVAPPLRFPRLFQRLNRGGACWVVSGECTGTFTLRDMYEQFQMILNMGPISQVMGMMPGLNSDMFKGSDAETQRRLKRYLTIIESMTDEGPHRMQRGRAGGWRSADRCSARGRPAVIADDGAQRPRRRTATCSTPRRASRPSRAFCAWPVAPACCRWRSTSC